MTPNQAGFVTGLLPFIGVFAVLLGGFLPLRFGTPRSYFI
jgi:nitrate/nitrite transporter NarK